MFVLSTDFNFCSPEGTVMERIQAQHGVSTGHIQRENTYRGFLTKARHVKTFMREMGGQQNNNKNHPSSSSPKKL